MGPAAKLGWQEARFEWIGGCAATTQGFAQHGQQQPPGQLQQAFLPLEVDRLCTHHFVLRLATDVLCRGELHVPVGSLHPITAEMERACCKAAMLKLQITAGAQ